MLAQKMLIASRQVGPLHPFHLRPPSRICNLLFTLASPLHDLVSAHNSQDLSFRNKSSQVTLVCFLKRAKTESVRCKAVENGEVSKLRRNANTNWQLKSDDSHQQHFLKRALFVLFRHLVYPSEAI